MAGSLLKSFEEDMSQIPRVEGRSDTPREMVMKSLAHAYLRLWTRLALESGQRLTLAPSQFTLGTYEGQMRWMLNENVDYKGIAQLSIGATFRKKHSLVAETYVLKGEERARVFFSLEEEKVKGRPVFVNYLVYEAPLGEFNVAAAMEALKPVLPAWLETIISADDKPLWSACDGLLECVGI
jgi:hypothetical protein